MPELTTAIVTGGAVRIGRTVARSLAAAGLRVVVHFNRSADAASETVGRIASDGGEAIAVCADLTRTIDAAQMVFDAAHSAFGAVDVLINNAAIFESGTLEDTTEDHWDRHFSVNLKAPFFMIQQLAAQLGNRRGHVINVADWRGTRPCAGHAAYALTKTALVALTRNLAMELAPRIQVNAVAPGAILPRRGASDADVKRLEQAIPLGRIGRPADVAAAVQFLLASDFVTGEVLHIAGGEQL